eukprot:IDg22193t1
MAAVIDDAEALVAVLGEISLVELTYRDGGRKSGTKTLLDRIECPLNAHKSYVANMEKASGVEESYGEREQTLDAILSQMKEQKEKKKSREGREESACHEAEEGWRGNARQGDATRRPFESSEETPLKKAKMEFTSGRGRGEVRSGGERQLALDKKRLQLDRERFELAQKQAEDARAQNAKLMELLTALVTKKNPSLREAPKSSLRQLRFALHGFAAIWPYASWRLAKRLRCTARGRARALEVIDCHAPVSYARAEISQ